MLETIKNHKTAAGVGGAVFVAVAAWLAFGVFGIHTAFIDNEVDEAGPVFASDAPTSAPQPSTGADGSQPSTGADGSEAVATEPEIAATAVPEATSAPEVTTVASGTFSGSGNYDVNGDALVLTDGSSQRFLRFENFEASNGPDLKVYLRATDDDFVSLGDLKGNIGDQNYEIPADVDLATYSTVQIWCERFSANFGEAPLT